ncbi:hypothetical protein [Actinoplanes sp. N902-109]|uniref:hypothetical protein n=1 Tax=Actinoplanes sp. (strain N902-109) TaxID=649831 RepID=UPI000329456A|nr:hypothetical protein [Actinoplanes sp. N902-109]AGL14651.1 hypothetical protein L083_1141 [Actinoplanes sp. N902-109]
MLDEQELGPTGFEDEHRADPARPLPAAYDRGYRSWPVGELADLRDWPVPAVLPEAGMPGSASPSHAATAALRGLPVGLARDLLAAAQPVARGTGQPGSTPHPRPAVSPADHSHDDIPGEPGNAGGTTGDTSVGRVLGPLRPILIAAMQWTTGHGHLANRLPAELWATTAEFASACTEQFAVRGDILDLPDTPPLPPRNFAGPGWLRVSYGETSGQRSHAPDCRVLKSLSLVPNQAPTWPAWRLNLPGTDMCTICGGPGVAATPALLGFLAAAVVWEHRLGETVERWQLRACLTMLAEAAADRAREVEPDISWYENVITELLADPPGERGSEAFQALTQSDRQYRKQARVKQLSALTLAQDRLEVLNRALPAHLRPEKPLRFGTRPSLQTWYKTLTEVCRDEIPHVELLLFDLSDVVES